MIAEFLNNKLLLTLTILYIILGSLAFYFNSKSWMQYKGDEKYSVEEKLDDQEDKKRSTRIRWSSLFIKNKIFFYIIFGTLGFISLLLAWLHRVIVGNKPTNAIPKSYFGDLFKFILLFFTIIGLFTIIFFLFSYAPTSLVFIINILNVLVILGVLAFVFEKTRKNQALLASAVIFAAIGGLIGGLFYSLIGGILGSIFGYIVGLKNDSNNKFNNKSNFIINITNDFWFGKYIGPYQHLYLTKIRAAEFNKPIIRVSNNGISAVIDNNGSIIKNTELNNAQKFKHKLFIKKNINFVDQHLILKIYFFILFFLITFYYLRKNV